MIDIDLIVFTLRNSKEEQTSLNVNADNFTKNEWKWSRQVIQLSHTNLLKLNFYLDKLACDSDHVIWNVMKMKQV